MWFTVDLIRAQADLLPDATDALYKILCVEVVGDYPVLQVCWSDWQLPRVASMLE